ncbi:MAG: DUF2892 domain-containing protein [Mariprofundus sp.]|nr:DUF2892 domain-containing protein [Mariprofundus sp.]
MAVNVGSVDRALRAVVGIALAVSGWLGIAGMAGTIVGVVGLVLFATALLSRCPVYSIVGMNSCEVDDPRGH